MPHNIVKQREKLSSYGTPGRKLHTLSTIMTSINYQAPDVTPNSNIRSDSSGENKRKAEIHEVTPDVAADVGDNGKKKKTHELSFSPTRPFPRILAGKFSSF